MAERMQMTEQDSLMTEQPNFASRKFILEFPQSNMNRIQWEEQD